MHFTLWELTLESEYGKCRDIEILYSVVGHLENFLDYKEQSQNNTWNSLTLINFAVEILW